MLTALAVPSPQSLVREAEFRKTYAQSSQYELAFAKKQSALRKALRFTRFCLTVQIPQSRNVQVS